MTVAGGEGGLWRAVDRLLADAEVEGIVAHKLGPLAARRLRALGEPIPEALANQERLARASMLTAVPLLGRIRAATDHPLLLIKGPEVACLYPDRARSFVDVDLLAEDGEAVHAALKADGFVEVDDPELFVEHHHLRPLQLPGLWLKVEVHLRPMLPKSAVPPAVGELVRAAVPSALGLEGILAPDPAHHALMLAAHGWVHDPLDTVRDLVDVAAVAQRANEQEIERVARAWGIERLWRTTRDTSRALLGEGGRSSALRLFGRHLLGVRERTVFENHVQRWLHPFWDRPAPDALRASWEALRQEVSPDPGEPWTVKLTRVKHAAFHPRRAMSAHTASWRRDVETREDGVGR